MEQLSEQETEQFQELVKNNIFIQSVEHFTYDHSLLMDTNLWSQSDHLLHDVDIIMAEVQDPGLRDKDKFRKHLIVVLVNLYLAELTSFGTWVAYSRNKNDYTTKSRYNVQRISHLYLTKAVDRLTEFGYVDHAKGFLDRSTPLYRGKLSRMRTTWKLRDIFEQWTENMIGLSPHVETIVLRDKNKQAVEYERDNRDVARARKNLTQLNGLIATADIRLDITDNELTDLNTQRKQHGEAPIRYWKKAMFRIFSNGSFKQGGRFYRGWWMGVGEEMRKRILIDGKETVEKDYSAIHPTILYARETGSLPPVDPYMIDGPATSNIVRKVAKKLLLVMINAMRGKSVKKAWVWHRDRYDNFSDAERQEVAALDIDDVIAKVKKHNKPIASYFSSNEGIKLQHQDSLLAEKIMMTLAKQGIVALPIHDSFIVQKRHEAALVQAMTDAFEEKFHVVPKIK